MSFLIECINNVKDQDLQEELLDRVAIVSHKIKFMEKVPVICLNSHQEVNGAIDQLLELAGGQVVSTIALAKVLIYFEAETGIAPLMGQVVAGLSPDWPAVAYNHVYLLDGTQVLDKAPQDLVSDMEDMAEILHPGSFVFGNEGKAWVNFSA